MKYLAIYIFSLLLFLLSFQKAGAEITNSDPSTLEYFGADHSEAEFTLQGQLIIFQNTPPTKTQADPMIRKQMRYMLGLMRSRAESAAALYPKYSFQVTEVVKSAPGKFLVKYTLNGKGVFANNATQYTFTIPFRPNFIFADSQGKCMKEKAVVEETFWYHWEPRIAGCPLQEGVNFYTTTSALKRLPNTVETYPEYQKLVDNNKTINVTVLFGFADYGYSNWNPDVASNDWGIKSFNMQREALKRMGFAETVWTKDQVLKLYQPQNAQVPYISEMRFVGANATVRIRLMLADTGLYHNSRAFHYLFREALAKESVVVYNGHSGIGKNLDLAAIEKLRGFKFSFNPNYQILFLGSCVPYAYYTDIFFQRKKTAKDPNGTLNLDIFTYGKESVFGNKEDVELMKALVQFAARGTKLSYQQIIRASPNYYIGINGDEDNPKTNK